MFYFRLEKILKKFNKAIIVLVARPPPPLLMVGPLKKITFFAASLKNCGQCTYRKSWLQPVYVPPSLGPFVQIDGVLYVVRRMVL